MKVGRYDTDDAESRTKLLARLSSGVQADTVSEWIADTETHCRERRLAAVTGADDRKVVQALAAYRRQLAATGTAVQQITAVIDPLEGSPDSREIVTAATVKLRDDRDEIATQVLRMAALATRSTQTAAQQQFDRLVADPNQHVLSALGAPAGGVTYAHEMTIAARVHDWTLVPRRPEQEKVEAEVEATILHELTHLALIHVYANDSLPYPQHDRITASDEDLEKAGAALRTTRDALADVLSFAERLAAGDKRGHEILTRLNTYGSPELQRAELLPHLMELRRHWRGTTQWATLTSAVPATERLLTDMAAAIRGLAGRLTAAT